MKISELGLNRVKAFCGVSESDSDDVLTVALDAAKAFVAGYTGLSAEQSDEHEDLTAAVLILVNEMFVNRVYTVDSGTINPTAKQIMDMHSRNLLA